MHGLSTFYRLNISTLSQRVKGCNPKNLRIKSLQSSEEAVMNLKTVQKDVYEDKKKDSLYKL